MNKLKILLFAIILTACATAPQQGTVDLHCSYVQQSAEKYSFVCEKINIPTSIAPVGATPTTLIPPASPTPTIRPTNTAVPSATKTPTTVPIPTVTTTPVPSGSNLFVNPGFEGGVQVYTWPDGLRLAEVAVAQGWKPFMCDFPYKLKPCPAKFQGTKNPNGLLMGRPEMRATDVANRVHSGSTAQYWFCFYRTCDGGVYQTIQTTPGQVCTASVYVQSWSRIAWDDKLPTPVNFSSGFPNDDAYSNSLWRIAVDPYGGVNIDSANVIKSSWYSVPKSITNVEGEQIEILNHYDKYVQMVYTFTAKGSFATVYFENLRLFPFAFNDSMVDDAAIVCSGGNGLPATAVPTVAPTITNTPVNTSSDCAEFPCFYATNVIYHMIKDTVPVYSTRSVSTSVVETYGKDREVRVLCVVEQKANEWWGSPFLCNSTNRWFIIKSPTTENAVVITGPEGY